MTVLLFSRCCLHSVLLLCICSCSYGVVSAQNGNVASGSKTDINEEDGLVPTRSYAEVISNVSEGSTLPELGMQLGDRCEVVCSTRLSNVICDERSGLCDCDKGFPVRLGAATGCAKPVALGSQCLHAQTCSFTDPNAECTQINHNAVCQCKPGYHVVSFNRPSKRVFCSPDTVILSGTDVHTLFAVATGLAILSGLICFVLKLFSRARYSRPRHYANANLAPPILFSSETGGNGNPYPEPPCDVLQLSRGDWALFVFRHSPLASGDRPRRARCLRRPSVPRMTLRLRSSLINSLHNTCYSVGLQ